MSRKEKLITRRNELIKELRIQEQELLKLEKGVESKKKR